MKDNSCRNTDFLLIENQMRESIEMCKQLFFIAVVWTGSHFLVMTLDPQILFCPTNKKETQNCELNLTAVTPADCVCGCVWCVWMCVGGWGLPWMVVTSSSSFSVNHFSCYCILQNTSMVLFEWFIVLLLFYLIFHYCYLILIHIA